MEKIFSVKNDFVDSRLDRWFRRNVCEAPQSFIEKSIRKGKIKINNKKKKSSYKLQKNDKIILYNFNFPPSKGKKHAHIYKATKNEISSSTGIYTPGSTVITIPLASGRGWPSCR